MPTYAWKCTACEEAWDVICRVADRDEPSACLQCKNPGVRQMTLPQISPTAGDWNRVEYNPGLGQWTKSWKHARQIAKSKGLEEVGNSNPDSIHKHHEQAREAKREERWQDAAREKLYD